MSGGFLALRQKRSKEKKRFDELEEAFNQADTNKDGHMTLDEWAKVLAKTGHDNPKTEVMNVFRSRDRDLNGVMTFEEFCGHKTRNEMAFEAIDRNGDGYVSRSEFRRICPNMDNEQREAVFNKFDKDGTGKITYQEFCEILNKSKST